VKIDKHTMRGVNRSNVLRCIGREGPINQSAIAEKVDLSIPSVMKIVDELASEGLVRRAGKGKSSGGKRPEMIELLADARYTIGVDMGRTTLRAAVCDLTGRVCQSIALPTGDTLPADLLLERVCAMIRELMERFGAPEEKYLGLGVAMPGLIEQEAGSVILSPDFSWENVPLHAMLSARLPLPVMIENANLSLARAEDRMGAGKNSNFLLCVNMGHGIGAGLLLDGHPYKGCSGTAGELGHMIVEPNGPLCTCGNRGCLEAVASGEAIRLQAIHMLKRGIPSLMTDMAQGDLSRLDAKLVFAAAARQDSAAQAIVHRAAEYIGVALANCVNLLDPDRIVLCGGLTRSGEGFQQMIRQHMDLRRMRGSGRSVKLRTGLLGEYASAMGAALQYIDAFFDAGGGADAART